MATCSRQAARQEAERRGSSTIVGIYHVVVLERRVLVIVSAGLRRHLAQRWISRRWPSQCTCTEQGWKVLVQYSCLVFCVGMASLNFVLRQPVAVDSGIN